jgi:hypothetical protein
MKRNSKLVLLLCVVAATFVWWMFGAYSTHGRAYFYPVAQHDSVSAVLVPPPRGHASEVK